MIDCGKANRRRLVGMASEAHALMASETEKRPHGRLQNLLSAFGIPMRTKRKSAAVGCIPTLRASVRSHRRTCPDAPIAYLVLGAPDHRAAFTTAIRAFALAGRLGDRLTLVGYGRYRRRLEKWVTALRIDAVVTFAIEDEDGTIDLSTFDTAIVLPRRDGHQFAIIVSALASGLCVISMGVDPKATELLLDRQLGIAVGRNDVLELSSAMLAVRPPERTTILERLAQYLIGR